MRIAVYAWVSTQRQSQMQTIEQQLERLQEHVQQHGWEWQEDLVFCDDGELPLLLREKGSGTRTVVEQYFHSSGSALPKACIELNNTEMMKRAVMAGLGYAFISQSALDEELLAKKIRIIPLANGVLDRSLFIIFSKGKQMSRATQAFLDMLEEK